MAVRPTPRQLALMVALTLMWGLNWPVMKISLREITPLWFRALTMTGGALLLWAVMARRGIPMAFPRAEWGRVALLGLANIIGWHFFSIIGLDQLASGRAAILGFTMPVWTALLTVLVLREPMGARVLLATAAAVAAVALLVGAEFTALMGRPLGVLWMQLAALSWAAGTLMMRRTATPMPNEAVTVWMLVLGAAFFWMVAPLVEPLPRPGTFTAAMWASMAWGVVINYAVTQVIWFGLARTLPPTASAFSLMAVPLVGTVGAAALVGEVPRTSDWLAAGAIMVAIAAALLPRRA